MIAVFRQVARRFFGPFGFDSRTGLQVESDAPRLEVAEVATATPGAALDDGTIDERSPCRDDSTAAAARRLLDLHMGG